MNKERLKGAIQNLKGRAKEAAGALTGDKKTQAKGTVERAAGAGREKLGRAEEELDRRERADEASKTPASDDEDPDPRFTKT